MKKLRRLFILGFCLFSLTGCIKRDVYENIKIYTTVYPIEYITNYLYGDYAKVASIYPSGVDLSSYVITSKKLNDYSKGNLFIYNGLSNEKDIAATLLNKNKKMDIIDVSQGLEIKSDVAELWLSPSNFLMMTSNVKNGLKNFVSHKTLVDSIDKNYDDLKLKISLFDAELKLIAENAQNKKIVVANNTFKFLEKYGFEVISIAEDEENSNTNVSQAQKLITSKNISYIFILEGTEESDTIKDLTSKGANKIEVSRMNTLSEEERRSNVDYFVIMNNFIDAIKSEVY